MGLRVSRNESIMDDMASSNRASHTARRRQVRCPTCGGDSDIQDERRGPHGTITRQRLCVLGHVFPTVEILAPTRAQQSVKVVQSQRRKWARESEIRRNPGRLSRAELALHYRMSIAEVRRIQGML